MEDRETREKKYRARPRDFQRPSLQQILSSADYQTALVTNGFGDLEASPRHQDVMRDLRYSPPRHGVKEAQEKRRDEKKEKMKRGHSREAGRTAAAEKYIKKLENQLAGVDAEHQKLCDVLITTAADQSVLRLRLEESELRSQLAAQEQRQRLDYIAACFEVFRGINSRLYDKPVPQSVVSTTAQAIVANELRSKLDQNAMETASQAERIVRLVSSTDSEIRKLESSLAQWRAESAQLEEGRLGSLANIVSSTTSRNRAETQASWRAELAEHRDQMEALEHHHYNQLNAKLEDFLSQSKSQSHQQRREEAGSSNQTESAASMKLLANVTAQLATIEDRLSSKHGAETEQQKSVTNQLVELQGKLDKNREEIIAQLQRAAEAEKEDRRRLTEQIVSSSSASAKQQTPQVDPSELQRRLTEELELVVKREVNAALAASLAANNTQVIVQRAIEQDQEQRRRMEIELISTQKSSTENLKEEVRSLREELRRRDEVTQGALVKAAASAHLSDSSKPQPSPSRERITTFVEPKPMTVSASSQTDKIREEARPAVSSSAAATPEASTQASPNAIAVIAAMNSKLMFFMDASHTQIMSFYQRKHIQFQDAVHSLRYSAPKSTAPVATARSAVDPPPRSAFTSGPVAGGSGSMNNSAPSMPSFHSETDVPVSDDANIGASRDTSKKKKSGGLFSCCTKDDSVPPPPAAVKADRAPAPNDSKTSARQTAHATSTARRDDSASGAQPETSGSMQIKVESHELPPPDAPATAQPTPRGGAAPAPAAENPGQSPQDGHLGVNETHSERKRRLSSAAVVVPFSSVPFAITGTQSDSQSQRSPLSETPVSPQTAAALSTTDRKGDPSNDKAPQAEKTEEPSSPYARSRTMRPGDGLPEEVVVEQKPTQAAAVSPTTLNNYTFPQEQPKAPQATAGPEITVSPSPGRRASERRNSANKRTPTKKEEKETMPSPQPHFLSSPDPKLVTSATRRKSSSKPEDADAASKASAKKNDEKPQKEDSDSTLDLDSVDDVSLSDDGSENEETKLAVAAIAHERRPSVAAWEPEVGSGGKTSPQAHNPFDDSDDDEGNPAVTSQTSEAPVMNFSMTLGQSSVVLGDPKSDDAVSNRSGKSNRSAKSFSTKSPEPSSPVALPKFPSRSASKASTGASGGMSSLVSKPEKTQSAADFFAGVPTAAKTSGTFGTGAKPKSRRTLLDIG